MTDEPNTSAEPEVQDTPEPPAGDPNPLGADIDGIADGTASPIYGTPGREGLANSRRRRLVAMVELPDRRELDFQARNLLLESDIRDAMAKAARRLFNHWQSRYSILGFEFNPDDIGYDLTRLRIGMDQGADTQIAHTEGLARVLVADILITRE